MLRLEKRNGMKTVFMRNSNDYACTLVSLTSSSCIARNEPVIVNNVHKNMDVMMNWWMSLNSVTNLKKSEHINKFIQSINLFIWNSEEELNCFKVQLSSITSHRCCFHSFISLQFFVNVFVHNRLKSFIKCFRVGIVNQ